MAISKSDLDSAFQALLPKERDKAFSPVSQKGGSTSLTKFSTSLVAVLVSRLPSPGQKAVVRAAFKGNTNGQSGGPSDGLNELYKHAEIAFSTCGATYEKEECLLDFLVTGPDVLDVLMTVESEAVSISRDADLYDLEKLLLVSAPRRVFIGRVNVTKTGKTDKLEHAKTAVSNLFSQAVQYQRLHVGQTLEVVLLETRHDSARVVHTAEFSLSEQRPRWHRVSLDGNPSRSTRVATIRPVKSSGTPQGYLTRWILVAVSVALGLWILRLLWPL